jgi:RNA polymerase sigma-70 factor (ECF subfamily)
LTVLEKRFVFVAKIRTRPANPLSHSANGMSCLLTINCTKCRKQKARYRRPDWKTTCLLFVVEEKNDMQEGTPFTADEQDFQRSILEMENVLSSRRRLLYLSAYKFLGNIADAEDAVQDALLSAYKHLGEFRGESQMSTWLTSIVKNSARMRLRRRSIRQSLSLDDRIGKDQQYSVSEQLTYPGPSPEDECRNSEFTAHLADVLAHLSPALRKAFQLRDLDGLTISEAARVLGVKEGTLKAQLSRARAKIRGLIRGMLDNGDPRAGTQGKGLGHYKAYASDANASAATLMTAAHPE